MKEESIEKKMIEEIKSYLNEDCSYLSGRSDYARGYKNGVITVREIIADIIKNYDENALMD